MGYWAFMGYEPISLYLAYFSMLRFVYYIMVYDAQWLLMLDGDSLILLDVMKVAVYYITQDRNNKYFILYIEFVAADLLFRLARMRHA